MSGLDRAKVEKCAWPEPRSVAVPNGYTFTVYALPEAVVEVPAYDATVAPNYVHQSMHCCFDGAGQRADWLHVGRGSRLPSGAV